MSSGVDPGVKPSSASRLRLLLSGLTPAPVKRLIKTNPLVVQHRSRYDNIFHCCVQRSASRWVRQILADHRTVRYSGMTTITYESAYEGNLDPRKITERTIDSPFPRKTIATPLYIDLDGYLAIPKPPLYRAFFVARDPRDLVTSNYFSWKESHVPIGDIPQKRQRLQELSEEDGLIYTIDALEEEGFFEALGSWARGATTDENVILVRFEDLTSDDNKATVSALFAHCDIQMPPSTVDDLLRDYAFDRLSGGRTKGQEATSSHYRRGIAGDWMDHFSDRVQEHFNKVTGDLTDSLGYPSSV